jgi:hypothetical protein
MYNGIFQINKYYRKLQRLRQNINTNRGILQEKFNCNFLIVLDNIEIKNKNKERMYETYYDI